MNLRKSLSAVVALFCLLALPLGFVNCQGASSTDNSTNQNTNDNTSTDCSDSELISLEAQMTQALQSAGAKESFYLELQRGLDGRIFTFSRPVDGKTTVTASTTLKSASTAKMITAAVILDVISNPSMYPPGNGVVNGRTLSLDSLARQFLPKTGGGTVWATTTGALPTTNRLFNVKLRHLLSFTSGLEEENACISSDTVSHNDCITRVVTDSVSLADNTANTGRTFFYNGSHLFVAAQMAVNATGMDSWASVFKRFKEIHGVFQTPVASPDAAAMGVGAFYPFSTAGTFSPSPAGAMQYKAGDYADFLLKLAKGQIVNTTLLDEMMSDQNLFLNASIKYSPTWDDGEVWHYGLGLWNECPALTYSAACVEDRYSSPGSFGSYPFADFNLWDGTPQLLVGFLGYGGTDKAQAIEGINLYRSLGGGTIGVKDLAQKWAANKCL